MIDPPHANAPKVEARRRQIIEAASVCARRAGFHGASMAEIAQTAGLSVGQIYRYFENKEAIIAAIVALDIAEMHDGFSELQASDAPMADAIIDNCIGALDKFYDPDRTALRLEVLSEAARNPRVAAILQAVDAEERPFKLDILRQAGPPGGDPLEQAARGEVLSMLFEGMAIRGLNNPNSDRAAVAEALRVVLRHILVEVPSQAPNR